MAYLAHGRVVVDGDVTGRRKTADQPSQTHETAELVHRFAKAHCTGMRIVENMDLVIIKRHFCLVRFRLHGGVRRHDNSGKVDYRFQAPSSLRSFNFRSELLRFLIVGFLEHLGIT